APLGQQWLWWLLFVLLLLVLVLTKSRTALLATVGGAALAIWYLSPLGKRLDVRIPLAVGAVLIACLIGGVASGLLDTKVLSEAPKSLLYRVQYWQSTAAMIAERPWFGCGPGNFQDTYLRYQLPEASENISDPHNFVLEIWANFGTLALVALLAVMGLFAWQVWNGAKRSTTVDETEPSPAPTASYRLICAAALVGVIMAYGCGFLAGFMPDFNLLISGVPIGALVLWLLRPWVAGGELNITMLVAALAALVVNLLVAGGIGTPGVATSLWLLLALTLTLVDVRTNQQPWQLARPLAGLVLVAVGIGGLLYHRTVYDPVLRSSALLSDAQLASERGRLDDTIRLLTEASAVDPYSPTPPLHLASLWKNRLLLAEDNTTVERTKFADACAAALERDPRSHGLWRELANWHLELYLRHKQPDDLTAATYYYLGAIERYPSESIGYAQLAWARHLAGQGALADQAAREALDLDSRHEHKEYKLKARRLFEMHSQPPLPWPEGTAEQVMRGLRTASDPPAEK
ncbi:MAG TPA: O-antigen ligase family protein, partial [Pirellulaceae bacterium]|nr:O-antigen ligase family protein [Pirellulaceae bacterium]